jgi:hypothetical protein
MNLKLKLKNIKEAKEKAWACEALIKQGIVTECSKILIKKSIENKISKLS